MISNLTIIFEKSVTLKIVSFFTYSKKKSQSDDFLALVISKIPIIFDSILAIDVLTGYWYIDLTMLDPPFLKRRFSKTVTVRILTLTIRQLLWCYELKYILLSI